MRQVGRSGVAWAVAAAAAVAVGAPGGARAEDMLTIPVTIKDHRFIPAEIDVPAGRRVVLRVTNADATVEEFDSSALQVEKVIPGGTYGMVWLRPLGPGRYKFMGEFHSDTAQGVVVAR